LLFTEADPAIYVYHQTFDHAGASRTRRGFLARCRLERFGEGSVFPHEETMPGPKEDRLRLTRACRANLSPVFGLYPDDDRAIQERLDRAIAGRAPLESTDHLGVVHRLWPVTDLGVIAAATAAMEPRPLFIADGHHRYETACDYQDELAAAEALGPTHPANYVLMAAFGMSDPSLLVLPTHRLFRGLPSLSAAELVARLGGCFSSRIAGEGGDMADVIWDELEAKGTQGALGLFTCADERWVVAQITDRGRARLAELAPERSPDWRDLGVAVLHKLVVESLLGAAGHPTPVYVHRLEEVTAALAADGFSLAALVMPAGVEHMRRVCAHGERMPAKSTYFYPKLLSGLVINPLD
jgi:uncharacterized protein (DUF1015 family)